MRGKKETLDIEYAAVVRERAAYRAGAYVERIVPEAEIARRYPFPARTRGVRVTLSDGHITWRSDDGVFWQRLAVGEEYPYSSTRTIVPNSPTAEDFRQLARLLDDEQEPENET